MLVAVKFYQVVRTSYGSLVKKSILCRGVCANTTSPDVEKVIKRNLRMFVATSSSKGQSKITKIVYKIYREWICPFLEQT